MAEPELNPSPWLDSPLAYAIVQALISTVLLFSFLFSAGEQETDENRAWDWATFTALLLLVSSMPGPYHFCLLIFTAIVAMDQLLKRGGHFSAWLAVVCFALASSPMPDFVYSRLQGRLVGVLLLYLVLLSLAPVRASRRACVPLFALAIVFLAAMLGSNLRAVHNRAEDFSRRLPPVSVGYGTFSAAGADGHVVLDEMNTDSYDAIILPGQTGLRMPLPGDVLAIAAGEKSTFVYFELTGARSEIFRLPVAQLGQAGAFPEYVVKGYDPAVAADGRSLAYLRDEGEKPTIWLIEDGAASSPVAAAQNLDRILEMSFTPNGRLIVAAGGAAEPYLVWLDLPSAAMRRLSEIHGAVRYPAVSPDGKFLAFSRRESGAWHLFLRNLEDGSERRLTSADCNAISPSWEDSQNLLYVSDCGRGLGFGAPARVLVHSAMNDRQQSRLDVAP